MRQQRKQRMAERIAQWINGYANPDYHYLSDIKTWWQKFKERLDYPLYCIILADSSDTEVASFMEKNLSELDAISGRDCCFIYFRDLEKAKSLASFNFQEHVRRVYPLMKFLDLQSSWLPCILFFEQLGEGDYVYISLANLSQQEIMALVRQIFDHLRKRKKSTPLAKLKRFRSARRIQMTGRALLRNIVEVGEDVIVKFFQNLLETYK
jgi:hypothetical protein